MPCLALLTFFNETPHFRDLHWLPVVSCIKCWQWHCLTRPCLPPSVSQNTHPSWSTPLNYLSWTPGTAITKSKQRSTHKITTLLFFGTAVVERAPCRCQDFSRSPERPQENQDTFAQSLWTLHSVHPYSSPPLPTTPYSPIVCLCVPALKVQGYCVLHVLALKIVLSIV